MTMLACKREVCTYLPGHRCERRATEHRPESQSLHWCTQCTGQMVRLKTIVGVREGKMGVWEE